jgi:hypothetical protein
LYEKDHRRREISSHCEEVAHCRQWGLCGQADPVGKKIVQFKGVIIGDAEAKERAEKGATAIMGIRQRRSIDGFDQGNGASWINHRRRRPNCFVLRADDEIWIVAGIEGIEAGEELT